MVKLKVTPLNLVAAAVASYFMVTTVLSPDTGVEVRGNVIDLDSAVLKKSTDPIVEALKDLDDDGVDHILLKINSPGGSVLDGRDVNSVISQLDTKVVTYSDNYFMSMGMDFFLQGQERLITKNALGMIHRGSAGGLTYHQLKLKLEALKKEIEAFEEAKADKKDKKDEVKRDLIAERSELEALRSVIDVMDKLFDETFKRLEEIKETAPDPEYLQSIIDSLKVGDRDIFLSADELIKSGIATKIVKNEKEANENS